MRLFFTYSFTDLKMGIKFPYKNEKTKRSGNKVSGYEQK